MRRVLFYLLFYFVFYSVLLSEHINYTVKSGDTLFAIANKNSMSIEELLKLNKIKNVDKYKLKVGAKLRVVPNVFYTLAYDNTSKSYAMVKIEKKKPEVENIEKESKENINKENSNKAENTLVEKETIIAKDNPPPNEEKTITAKAESINNNYYTVVKGDTLYGIAFKHDMKVSDFLLLNDIKDSSKYNLLVGTKLKIKKMPEDKVVAVKNNTAQATSKEQTSTTTSSTTVKKVERIEYYEASKGDTLYGIATKHNMKVSDFLLLNDIKDSSKYNLLVGTKLKVKKIVEEKVVENKAVESKTEEKSTVAKNNTEPTTSKATTSSTTVKKVERIEYYKASKGDTLYGIAFKHDMKVSDFLLLNNIKDSSKYNLLVGEKLKVKKIVEEKIVENKAVESKTEEKNTVVDNSKNNNSKPVEKAAQTSQVKTSSNKDERLVENYTAKSGDTLSEIAEYFGMDLIDLYVLNKLESKYTLKIGDKLYVYNRVATDYNTKKYTVKNGDTLYSIARNNNMSLNELLDVNSIDIKKYTLQSGANLKVYKKESIATARVNNQDEIKNRVAGSDNKNENSKTTDRPDINLLWPHKGSIITSYGVRKDKIANRGISIAGNSGDKVAASEEGIVEYAGTIRGFGNVVIIKHENNYTTSYAHLSSMSVNIGDFVKKGEKIGAIGNSGIVDKNELYFKVSYLGMPINPILVLPKS